MCGFTKCLAAGRGFGRSASGRAGLVLALVIGAAGCESTRPAVRRTLVQLADLGATGANPDVNTFALVETQASIGRFPAGVSVARVMIEDAVSGGRAAMAIDRLLDPEALYWNELFDSIPRVREVLVIDPQSVPQRYVTIPMLLESSRRLRCRICVIYAQNDVADSASQLLGAVYDADTSELIGTAFAEEVVDPKARIERPADRPDGDDRHRDAHWLAARKFEQIVRGFVSDLISRDREPGAPAEPGTQPTPPPPAAPGPAPVTSAPGGP